MVSMYRSIDIFWQSLDEFLLQLDDENDVGAFEILLRLFVWIQQHWLIFIDICSFFHAWTTKKYDFCFFSTRSDHEQTKKHRCVSFPLFFFSSVNNQDDIHREIEVQNVSNIFLSVLSKKLDEKNDFAFSSRCFVFVDRYFIWFCLVVLRFVRRVSQTTCWSYNARTLTRIRRLCVTRCETTTRRTIVGTIGN